MFEFQFRFDTTFLDVTRQRTFTFAAFLLRNKHGRIFIMAAAQWRLSSNAGTGFGTSRFANAPQPPHTISCTNFCQNYVLPLQAVSRYWNNRFSKQPVIICFPSLQVHVSWHLSSRLPRLKFTLSLLFRCCRHKATCILTHSPRDMWR